MAKIRKPQNALTLGEYAAHFIDMIKNCTDEELDMPIVSSKDDEGNGYNFLYYGATKGHYDQSEDQFYTPGDLKQLGKKGKINAILL